MAPLEEGKIQIHTENIFPIIKKAVYSDHEIFLRELVSNSVDAINKRRMASLAGDCDEGAEGSVQIKIDRELKTLTISDNGIGMTKDEVKKYINQVAFSSAEEFLEKYKKADDGIIGHFGLGFYSSFMVAKNVELITKSARKESKAIKWNCDGSPSYSLEDTDRAEPGTDVILYLMEEEIEYIEPTRIKTLVAKYCDFMPVKIEFEGEEINKRNPIWRKSNADLTDKDYKELYNYLYPFQGDPLLWIHLNTDYPYNLQGILYFPKTSGRADWEKGEIKLFCNQVFVSDSIKEVVPRYLLPLRGVIDSPDIPLNVSRSALQSDRRVKSIGNFIAKKIADKLRSLKKDSPEFYSEIWDSLAPFIKIGAMEDDKFAEQVSEIILFQSTVDNSNVIDEEKNYLVNPNGTIFTTIDAYKDRITSDTDKKVIYCTDELAQASPLELWKAEGVEVIKADTIIDTQFIPWLENRYEDLKFQRVDAELDNNLKDDKPEITNQDGETKSERLRKTIIDALNNDKVTVQIQALKGEQAPPAMILLPEQMRRINDVGALMEQRLPGLPEHHVLLVNQNHELVEGILKINSGTVLTSSNGHSTSESLASELSKHLYDMARLGVGGLEPKELAGFQRRSANLMGLLVNKTL